jgi:hypothetical protein
MMTVTIAVAAHLQIMKQFQLYNTNNNKLYIYNFVSGVIII